MPLQEFSSDDFTWTNGKGRSSLEKLGLREFPRAPFLVRSTRSQKVMTFIPDGATMEANEFFDGEASAYCSDNVFIQIWV